MDSTKTATDTSPKEDSRTDSRLLRRLIIAAIACEFAFDILMFAYAFAVGRARATPVLLGRAALFGVLGWYAIREQPWAIGLFAALELLTGLTCAFFSMESFEGGLHFDFSPMLFCLAVGYLLIATPMLISLFRSVFRLFNSPIAP